ncbi:DUF4221 domain-containing protein [Belliella sp. R4-6]|uniref:DUF4221 domain-containing protein n=1 Tax=Belliella alkalica TaxID=1730871 RepID=A0ABS9V8Y4_9BACT|nr:DUF4221 domain-containing protein [Belliella alkalica]
MSGFNLLKYEYPSGKLISNITFEKEGPDGIGGYVSGNLITKDVVFFISSQKEITQAGHDGKVINRYLLPESPEERIATQFSTNRGNKMNWNTAKEKLIVPDVPILLKEKSMKYKDWLWEFNLKENTKEVALQFTFPKEYNDYFDDPELGTYYHLLIEKTNKHLVAFPATDSILVFSEENSSKIFAGSNSQLEFKKGKTEAQGEYTVFLPSVETSRYQSMMHDPYQGLILRHLIIEQGKNENGVFSKNSFVILDESLSKIGEVSFSSRIISSLGFCTPNGLYLKMMNQNSDDQEAYIRFIF